MEAAVRITAEVEATGRRHDVERVADRELVGREFSERPARLHAHADFKRPSADRRADAVRATQGLAAALKLNRQMLPGKELVFVPQFVGHIESKANGVASLGCFRADSQRVIVLHCLFRRWVCSRRFAAEAAPTDT
jgi:hypothetical protein